MDSGGSEVGAAVNDGPAPEASGSAERPVGSSDKASVRSPERASPVDSGARFTMRADISGAVVGFYAVLIGFLLLASQANLSVYPLATYGLAAILAAFLLRYASARYILGPDRLRAWRLFGVRTVKLDRVRRIEFANLRDLGPVGFFGSWGYRGRMWSPVIGSFDSVYTASKGILVTAGRVPLFISPKDPAAFAKELSRRVRSYTGPLEVDAGQSSARATAFS